MAQPQQQLRRNPAQQPVQQALPLEEPEQPYDPFNEPEAEAGNPEVFDLSDVPESPTFEAIPQGIYDATIDSVTYGMSQRSNNPMLTWVLKVPLEDGQERTLFYHTTLNGNGLSRTKRSIAQVTSEGEVDWAHFKPTDMETLLPGRDCRIRVRIGMYNGERRNNVSDLMAAPEGGFRE